MRNYEVSCADHGLMERDNPRMGYTCPDEGCRAWLPDEEVRRLLGNLPEGYDLDPVPIVVT